MYWETQYPLTLYIKNAAVSIASAGFQSGIRLTALVGQSVMIEMKVFSGTVFFESSSRSIAASSRDPVERKSFISF